MTTPLIIIGAGGLGREITGIVDDINAAAPGTWEILGFVDDGEPDTERLARIELPHLGGKDCLGGLSEGTHYVIGIGSGAPRRKLSAVAEEAGLTAATLVHPSASVGRDVGIAPGSILCAGVTVTTNVDLGAHTILNLGVTVGHDTVLEDFVTVHPQVALSGECRIGTEVVMGTSSAIIQGRSIGARTIVGAGAVVVKDLPADVTAVGAPAKPLVH